MIREQCLPSYYPLFLWFESHMNYVIFFLKATMKNRQNRYYCRYFTDEEIGYGSINDLSKIAETVTGRAKYWYT